MRAARFDRYGGAEEIYVAEVAAPEPGEGEVSLRVMAAGVNPIDWKILHGWLAGGKELEEPRGLGVDVAGIVEKAGPGVEGLHVGQEVLGASSTAAYAEVALSRPQMLIEKPPGIAWELAGGLAVVIGTAYATLHALALQAGETLLVAGASGSVGSAAVQLAVGRGVRVIGTAGPSKLAQVQALGAVAVAYGEGLEGRLREAAPGGFDAALDASGHGELKIAAELTRTRERILTIASSAEAGELGLKFHAGGGGALTTRALREVLALIEAGRFSFPLAGIYDLGQAGEALRESEHGHPAGKLVIVPG